MEAVLRIIVVLVTLRFSSCQSGEDISKIHDDVITLNPMVRPVANYHDQIVVRVAFHLMSINNFDTVQQKFTTNGWMEVEWLNHYSTWDPAQYGGAYLISPKPDSVWRPKLTVINSLKELKPIGQEYVYTLLSFDGRSYWYPAERFETSCSVDVTYFPFDTQRCKWQIFVWGEGGAVNQTDLDPMRPYVDLDFYVTNGEWELMSSRVWKTLMGTPDGSLYPHIHYEVTIRRRPSLLALTVLLPVVVLAGINVFVFTIPSESGERLSYAITALLSFGVFMSFILESMPSSTETLSIVAVNMSCLLVLSAVYVLCCILSLRLFHRDDHKHPVPKSLQTVIVWLEVLVCLDPPSRNKVHVIQVDNAKEDKSKGIKLVTRKWRHDAYTDPAEMTWRRVSRTLDKLFFRFFAFLILASNIAVWITMGVDYAQNA
ncbi:hypothetical protein BaRGS_00013794 [Batillaria attramentaria]|uniref:Uncharacterized protein n=1 Tax=Batillaria attramentaria TaxID=370345 RepID=A0ABD0L6G5_9CAEN